MLTRLGRFVVRRRKTVLIVAMVGFAAAAIIGARTPDRLTSAGFNDPDSESERGEHRLAEAFGPIEPGFVLLVSARGGRTVDDPEVAAAGRALTEELAAEPEIADALSYWSLSGAVPLRSEDERQALVLAAVAGDDDAVLDTVKRLSADYERTDGLVQVEPGGSITVYNAVNEQAESDLLRAEAIALPLTLILLIIVFGSLVAAALPLATGVFTIVGTLVVLFAVSLFTDVSIFALNLTTVAGLGLAIDYSLFIVSRFREELGHGRTVDDAVVRTVETAGRTVTFSALTVAVALTALLVMPTPFLRSFAYAGIPVCLVCAIGSVVVLPAALSLLGTRIDAFRLFRRRAPAPDEHNRWRRIATAVMRRPLLISVAVVAMLLVLGLPVLRIELGIPDDRVLPPGHESREVTDQLRDNYAAQEAVALTAVSAATIDPTTEADEIHEYALALSALDGVARVDAPTGNYIRGQQALGPSELTDRFATDEAALFRIVIDVEPVSSEGEDLANAVRDVDAPFPVLITGESADLVDFKSSLAARLPLALTLLAVSMFVLLFLAFGSVLVPIKALIMNVLSLSATFGAMVFVFQDGRGADLLAFTPTGSIVGTVPVLMFVVAFGLSMDYEVFLLSRIKEEYDRTGDNATAVALGLERTGGIVTAAAFLISVVLSSMIFSGIAFLKMFGLGLALAILMDAFVIRATLVPAFMRLAGRANWWAPRSLLWVHERIGIRETETEPEPEYL